MGARNGKVNIEKKGQYEMRNGKGESVW
jgi:hypothetical protein